MGQQAKMKKREVRHRTKLFGGIKTAQEVHAEFGFRQKCLKCGGPPAIQIRCMMLHDEFVAANPPMAALIAAKNGGHIPCIPTTYGPMVKFAEITACRLHQKEAEQDAAKGPSNVLVEIDYGAGCDKPFIQVPAKAMQ